MSAFDSHSPQFRVSASGQTQIAKKVDLSTIFQQIIEGVLTGLSPAQQPQIRSRQNRQGETVWTVYDPASRVNQQFDSEQEVRIWLEQRYYE